MAGATFTIPLITVIPGQLITAALWNNEWNNIATNLNPSGLDGYSDTDIQMQIQTNPYPGSVTSHANSLGGELERIRYVIAQITGNTYWYQPVTTPISFLENIILPIGGIIDYPSNIPPTSNFLSANGQTVSRAGYPALFSLYNGLSTPLPFGVGDGTTTFNLPNYTDMFSIGAGGSFGSRAGINGGAISNTPTLIDPGHNHTQNSHLHVDSGHAHSTPNHQHILSSIAGPTIGAITGEVISLNTDGAALGTGSTPPGSSFSSRLNNNQTTLGGASTTGTGNALIGATIATNNSNTTGITSPVIPTVPPFISMYKMVRVL